MAPGTVLALSHQPLANQRYAAQSHNCLPPPRFSTAAPWIVHFLHFVALARLPVDRDSTKAEAIAVPLSHVGKSYLSQVGIVWGILHHRAMA